MSPLEEKSVIQNAAKYGGIATGLPFLMIVGFYIGTLVGDSWGSPWDTLAPILGIILPLSLVVGELLLVIGVDGRKRRKEKEEREKEETETIDG